MASAHDFGEVPMMESDTFHLYVHNTNGNQAILLKGLTMYDSTTFTLVSPVTFPRFLKPGDSLLVSLEFAPPAIQNYADTLYFSHTGSNGPTTKVILTGEGVFNWFGAQRAYVDLTATGSNLGNSWEDAFPTLQEGLSRAAQFPEITEVWVADGTYTPANTRASSFIIPAGVTVYGGFDGTEILLSQRDIDDFPVVLSGDIGVPDDSTDNVYHVILVTTTTDTSILDGLFIEKGVANGMNTFDQQGAGVLNLGKLAMRSVSVRYCTSVLEGSGLLNSGSEANAVLENVRFHSDSDPYLKNVDGATLNWLGFGNSMLE
jgi:hypothetical protein